MKEELTQALSRMLGKPITFVNQPDGAGLIIRTTSANASLGSEGFQLQSNATNTAITLSAQTDIGLLYGGFHLLRLMQTRQPLIQLNIHSTPKLALRLLNHWDNLNRYVERGYAGISIFNWHTLPGYIDQRYIDYARANASIGINGTVLTNVNANAWILTGDYLQKVKALADVFRPYGIKVYLTARFSAPIEMGGLSTADPLQPQVQQWWQQKVKEIYTLIPDFGGFLVKANSEGQPGPQDYKRTHADGANMLADAVAPYNGIIMWRAFVYSHETPEDRFKQAYNEFKPLDGQFRKNVMVQVKNGPIDFQPREPFSPLFGAMPQTPLMMEFQLTQEYLGQGTHLVYEAPMFKETLDADTHINGKGSTVTKSVSGIAGVANIGNDINWCSHPFAQANWYALGKLAWNPAQSSETIAEEWIRQTWSNKTTVVNTCKQIMLQSREAMVNYMTPLGLHHIMGNGHHYGPLPWGNTLPRADWNPVYYHRADSAGIGFNRTATGSNALAQYHPAAAAAWADSNTCSSEYLLWFHHVSWQHRMPTGRSLWQELCFRYNQGVAQVRTMQQQWQQLQPYIDKERYTQVQLMLGIQQREAVWWRDACLLYFQQFSQQPIPAQYEKPAHTLEYYQNLKFPYAPGNG
ncbi:xylan alpha-1,2-glucuronidase [Filimonas zeae]|uniref:Xylan alpha-1,2-glucuronidase n=1 Tax=Filimonas zeae TaxID=1737353 RepID=A0A917IQ07_9BACT|nr:xylan alpha-1,2-glucuronidase [Filimonas zeae]